MTSMYDYSDWESLGWALDALDDAAKLCHNRRAVYEYWFDLAVELARGPLGARMNATQILAHAAREVCWEIHTLR